jgi:hypothetical protein
MYSLFSIWILPFLLLFISAESIDRSSGKKKRKKQRRKENSGARKKNERLDEDRWQKEPLRCSLSSYFLTSVRSTPYYTNTIPNNQFLYYRPQIYERTTSLRQKDAREKKRRINYKVIV